jgi:hypothetical protein
MKSRYLWLLLLLILASYIAQTSTPALEPATFRIIFGEADASPSQWDSQLAVSGARVTRLELWRADDNDRIDGTSGWKLSTLASPPGTAQRLGKVAPKGVIVTAEGADPQTRFDVSTPNGKFSFTPAAASFTKNYTALDGRVRVERVPAVDAVVRADGDQDNPAMAVSGDSVYLTYTEFSHSNREAESFAQRKEAPANFDWLSRPAGGDQVKLIRYSKSNGKWSDPEEVSPRHEDVMRSAVAVDGSGRVWVVWSANRGGNFDIYARYSDKGRWSREVRISSDPGTDVNPVAATDSSGRVWLAWQGFRGTNLDVLAAVQTGDHFTPEQRVSFSPASDWDPAIAAGPRGDVAVTWDTYDKGDYDVYARVMRFGTSVEMDAPVAIAASARFEARSSAAYDGSGRLWVAYETSDERWGKDFGVYDIKGVSLYRGQTVRVRCLQAGRLYEPKGSLEHALNFAPGLTGREGPPAMKQNNPGIANVTVQGPRNSLPRLTADSGGRVYLTFRSGAGQRSRIGSIFQQFLTFYNGSDWTPAVEVPLTQGPVDLRPALLATAPGELLEVAITDHRKPTSGPIGEETTGSESDNLDRALMAVTLRIASPATTPSLSAIAKPVIAQPAPDLLAERAAIATLRSQRLQLPAGQFQVLRGEFHRHTEFSADGGADGPLIDAYRYLIDTAGMDWGGCCDHDNGGGREYSWWLEQKFTDAYHLGESYVPMFAYERSVAYPEGHRNVIFVQRGIRPLPRLPKTEPDSAPNPAPDTQMLYRYLRQYSGVAASHTSGTGMGTDWRDNDPLLEPVVEIYQGERQNYEMPGAPRSMTADFAIGQYRPLGFVSNALKKGYRLGFESSSDHISTHISYCNLWVTNRTREGVIEAFRKRRIYGSTDNILADVRCGEHFMGEEFSLDSAPVIRVHLIGTGPFEKVHIIRDGNEVYTTSPQSKDVNFEWRDAAPPAKGSTSYYYVRGEQADKQLVWASPMWIHFN